MPVRHHARTVALSAVILTLGAVAPALGAHSAMAASGPAPRAGSGGAGLSGTGLGAIGVTPTPSGPVSAQGDGITLSTSAASTFHSALIFSGSVPAADRGDEVALQRATPHGAWQTVARTVVAGDGSFTSTWTASTSGLTSFRVSLGGPAGTAQAAAMTPANASPPLAVTIYRNQIATLYGPGFYGRRTACGQTLTRATFGVASRTLKCGTKVSISYKGESIVVPVIDRGPYANHATWDLTTATAAALGDPDTETVGAAVL